VEYTVKSDYIFFVDPWRFQYDIPVRRSEFHFNAIKEASYTSDVIGYFPVEFTTDRGTKNMAMPGGVAQIYENRYHYTAENIPHFPDEPYLYTRINYMSAVKHSLISFTDGFATILADDWGRVSGRLMDEERFGGVLKKKTQFKEAVPMLKAIESPEDRIKAAFGVVKDHYTWDGDYSLRAKNSASKAYELRVGNTAGINLALIALLREVDIEARPAVLSTRGHGYLRLNQVNLSALDAVIAVAYVDTVAYFMDATRQNSDVNMMPPEYYNLNAVEFDKERFKVVELKQTNLYGIKAASQLEVKEGKLTGKTEVQYSGYGAFRMRSEFAENENAAKIMETWASEHPGLELNDHKITGKDSLQTPFAMKLDATYDVVEQAGNLLIIRPWLIVYDDENPLKSARRDYPVEFNYPEFQSETTKIKIPAGYAVESLPKSIKLILPDNSAKFRCSVEQKGDEIIINTSQQLTRTLYLPTEYNDLRQFFQQMVDKQKEKIILKKI
jgi:Transglutaminase-like superfamily